MTVMEKLAALGALFAAAIFVILAGWLVWVAVALAVQS